MIGPTGLPLWSELAVGKDKVQPHLGERMGVDSRHDRDALMDLPPTGLDRYRFQVEVCQRKPRAIRISACMPAAIACRRRGAKPKRSCLTFTDKDPEPSVELPGRWQLAVRPYEPVRHKGSVFGGLESTFGRFEPKVDESSLVCWHTIVVDVTPTGLTWTFDGKRGGQDKFPLSDARRRISRRRGLLIPGVRTAFSPAGGYGLVVHGGLAVSATNGRSAPLIPEHTSTSE